MDPERHTCTWKNEPVTLTVTEFLILQALATRPGVVKSRNALMDAAYDDQVYVDDRTIDSHIKRLRKKFKVVDDDFEMIETLYKAKTSGLKATAFSCLAELTLRQSSQLRSRSRLPLLCDTPQGRLFDTYPKCPSPPPDS